MVLAMLSFALVSLAAQSREAQIKAAFVFNFVQFTEWPAESFATTNSPLIIAVSGAPPVEQALKEITHGETMRGHPFEVRPVSSPVQAAQAHILFVASSESARWQEYRNVCDGRPVLTVSDMPGFARRGGMIELFTRENKLRLRANPETARRAHLQLSSRLLRLAEIVESGGEE